MDDFQTLPRNLQLRIDDAFDAALASGSSFPTTPPLNQPCEPNRPGGFIADAPGGFIVEADVVTPGGFVLSAEKPQSEQQRSAEDWIPFARIPSALQILDLPPDDEEILQVFRNAATGWTGDSANNVDGEDVVGGTVCRKDWRAVCAVVIGTHEEDGGAYATGGFLIEDDFVTSSGQEPSYKGEGEGEAGEEGEEGTPEDGYAYTSSDFSDTDVESDSDEYMAGPSTKARRSKRTRPVLPTPGAPTPRQKRAALDAFAMFFPSQLTDADLTGKRLMFKDVVMVAEILKEKIKADEITEMLTLFSTSPDHSMSFDDFARMMIMAKLVWQVLHLLSFTLARAYRICRFQRKLLIHCQKAGSAVGEPSVI